MSYHLEHQCNEVNETREERVRKKRMSLGDVSYYNELSNSNETRKVVATIKMCHSVNKTSVLRTGLNMLDNCAYRLKNFFSKLKKGHWRLTLAEYQKIYQ